MDHVCEVLRRYVTQRRGRKSALKFMRKLMKRNG
ncbi:hypothetical protein [uncultured Planktomarina sp.]